MKTLIEILIISIFSIVAYQGGKSSLKKTHDYIQRLALEKAAQGLGDLEPIAQRMTGGKLDF